MKHITRGRLHIDESDIFETSKRDVLPCSPSLQQVKRLSVRLWKLVIFTSELSEFDSQRSLSCQLSHCVSVVLELLCCPHPSLSRPASSPLLSNHYWQRDRALSSCGERLNGLQLPNSLQESHSKINESCNVYWLCLAIADLDHC